MGSDWLEKIGYEEIVCGNVNLILKKLASIDVDRIAKDVDFQALQQNVMNIAFCNIQTEVINLWFL